MKDQYQEKIIGGNFGLPQEFLLMRSNPVFLDGNPVLLFNARSGIKLVIDYIKPRTVWLPSYLSPDILQAINPNVTNIAFYPVDYQLETNSVSYKELLKPGDLFLFIDYFGFPFDSADIKEIKMNDCWVFRDCNQSLFHDWRRDDCDFYLYCPRKFLGVPDGGILHFRENIKLKIPNLSSPDYETMYHLFYSLVLRRDFDIYGGNQEWFKHFQIGEVQLKPGKSSMSDITRLLLKMAFDYQKIKIQRRLNYQALSHKLGEIALFSDLFENVIPLGFPIRLENRDSIRQALIKKNIYPPVHWDIKGSVPEDFSESHKLSQKIMTLPCDQRYTVEDMNFMADTLLEILS